MSATAHLRGISRKPGTSLCAGMRRHEHYPAPARSGHSYRVLKSIASLIFPRTFSKVARCMVKVNIGSHIKHKGYCN
jgi:hypothetical protein